MKREEIMILRYVRNWKSKKIIKIFIPLHKCSKITMVIALLNANSVWAELGSTGSVILLTHRYLWTVSIAGFYLKFNEIHKMAFIQKRVNQYLITDQFYHCIPMN